MPVQDTHHVPTHWQVTAIGGTTAFNPEVSVSLSGCGFSDYFTRPIYKEGAVSTFLQHLPPGARQ